MPVIACRADRHAHFLRRGPERVYMSELYLCSCGGERQIIAPLRPSLAQRSSSLATAFGSYNEISASPAIRFGA